MAGLPPSSVKDSVKKTMRSIRARISSRMVSRNEYHYYENQDIRKTVKNTLEDCIGMENVDLDLLVVVHYNNWMYISQDGESGQYFPMRKEHCPELVANLMELNAKIEKDFKKMIAPMYEKNPRWPDMEDDIPLEYAAPSLVYVALWDPPESLSEDEFKTLAEAQQVLLHSQKYYLKHGHFPEQAKLA